MDNLMLNTVVLLGASSFLLLPLIFNRSDFEFRFLTSVYALSHIGILLAMSLSPYDLLGLEFPILISLHISLLYWMAISLSRGKLRVVDYIFAGGLAIAVYSAWVLGDALVGSHVFFWGAAMAVAMGLGYLIYRWGATEGAVLQKNSRYWVLSFILFMGGLSMGGDWAVGAFVAELVLIAMSFRWLKARRGMAVKVLAWNGGTILCFTLLIYLLHNGIQGSVLSSTPLFKGALTLSVLILALSLYQGLRFRYLRARFLPVERAVQSLSEDLSGTTSIQDLYPIITQYIESYFGLYRVDIYLESQSRRLSRSYSSNSLVPEVPERSELLSIMEGDDILSASSIQQAVVLEKDPEKVERLRGQWRLYQQYHIQYIIPVSVSGHRACLVLGSEEPELSLSEFKLLQSFSYIMGVSLRYHLHEQDLMQVQHELSVFNQYHQYISDSSKAHHQLYHQLLLTEFFDIKQSLAFSIKDGRWVIEGSSDSPEYLAELQSWVQSQVPKSYFVLHKDDAPNMSEIFKTHNANTLIISYYPSSFPFTGLIMFSRNFSRWSSTTRSLFYAFIESFLSNLETQELLQSLKQQDEYLQSIFSQVDIGVMVVAKGSLAIRDITPHMRAFLGPDEFYFACDYYEECPVLKELLQEGQDEKNSLEWTDSMGTQYLMSSVPIQDAEESYFLVTMTALTRLRQLEQILIHSDRLSSLATVSAGISHEIKNPLVAIKTFTQLLEEKWEDPRFQSQFKSIVPAQIERIHTLCHLLMDLGASRRAHYHWYPLQKILKNVQQIIPFHRGSHAAMVELDPSIEHLNIYTDLTQMTQILVHLINNALESLPEGDQNEAKVYVSASRLANCTRLEIRDTGRGIAKKDFPQIFNPFFSTHSDDHMGLGLSTVHRLVQAHQGHIAIESSVGTGTCVTLDIPGEGSRTEPNHPIDYGLI